jgi:hypothetical protein
MQTFSQVTFQQDFVSVTSSTVGQQTSRGQQHFWHWQTRQQDAGAVAGGKASGAADTTESWLWAHRGARSRRTMKLRIDQSMIFLMIHWQTVLCEGAQKSTENRVPIAW